MKIRSTQLTSGGDTSRDVSAKKTTPHWSNSSNSSSREDMRRPTQSRGSSSSSNSSSENTTRAGVEAAKGHSASNSILRKFLSGARSFFPLRFYCMHRQQSSAPASAQPAGNVDFEAAASLHPTRSVRTLFAPAPPSPASAAAKAVAAAAAAGGSPIVATTFAGAAAPPSNVVAATTGPHRKVTATSTANAKATAAAAAEMVAAATTYSKAATASASPKEAAAAAVDHALMKTSFTTPAAAERKGEAVACATANTFVAAQVPPSVPAVTAAEAPGSAAIESAWDPAPTAARPIAAALHGKGRGEGRAVALRRLAASAAAAAAFSAAVGASFLFHAPASISAISSFAAAAAPPNFLRLFPSSRSPFLQFASSRPSPFTSSSSKPQTLEAATPSAACRSCVAASSRSSPAVASAAAPVAPLAAPGSFILPSPPYLTARPSSLDRNDDPDQSSVWQQEQLLQQQQISQRGKERGRTTSASSSSSVAPSLLFSAVASVSSAVERRFPIFLPSGTGVAAGSTDSGAVAAAAGRGEGLPYRVTGAEPQRHFGEYTTSELLRKGSGGGRHEYLELIPSASLLTTKASATHDSGRTESTERSGSSRSSKAYGDEWRLTEDGGEPGDEVSSTRAFTAAAAAAKEEGAAAAEDEGAVAANEEGIAAATPPEVPERQLEYTSVPLLGHDQQQQQTQQLQKEEEQTQTTEKIVTFPPFGMAWRCTGSSNEELVNRLREEGVIKSRRVYEAMKAVDRGNFVDACAYVDSPQPLGIGSATISAPHMHAAALEELVDHLKPGSRVLDVGSGSGYLTVVMAYAVGVKGIGDDKAAPPDQPEGTAIGIDYVPGLVKYSREHVKKAYPHLLKNPNFQLVEQDGWDGYPSAAPFDAIHVGAAAASIPRQLLRQLKNGGKMVLPVEESVDGEIMIEGEDGEKPLSAVTSGSSRSIGEGSSGGRGRGILVGEKEEEEAQSSSSSRTLWRKLLMGGGGQRFVAITKDAEGNTHMKKLMGVMYVPLVKRKESSVSSGGNLTK